MIKTLDKNSLRKNALNLRASIYSADLNKIIYNKIINLDLFKNAKNIALYYPIKNEVDLAGLFNFKEKNYFLPRCNGDDIEFRLYKGFEFLKKGQYGIFEPQGEKINPDILDIIFIPALLVNSKNYRLGYGKGYYDRFFKDNNINAKKIIPIYSKLINDDFIEEAFDVKADIVITEL